MCRLSETALADGFRFQGDEAVDEKDQAIVDGFEEMFNGICGLVGIALADRPRSNQLIILESLRDGLSLGLETLNEQLAAFKAQK